MQVENIKNKDRFIEIFNDNIKREGSNKLLEWLERSDFFEAPASIKFHNSFEGGLCEHSINCFERFKKIVKDEYGENYAQKVSDESVAIISLLHDICKVNYYSQETRNAKVNGEWVQVPYFSVDDKLPYGHGEKSVYIVGGFIKLTREEAMAINWHMGGFDSRVQGGSYSLSDAFYGYPVALLFHVADLEATYLDEKRNN